MTTCDTCKRPVWKADLGRRNEEEWCFERPNLTCRMIALGYQRGVLDGRREMLTIIADAFDMGMGVTDAWERAKRVGA